MGGSVVDDPELSTHLVSDSIKRTAKTLMCISCCKHIVTSRWLLDSQKVGHFINEEAYIVKDVEAEREWKFNLKESLRLADNQLFTGFRFFVLEGSVPPKEFLANLIRVNNGTLLTRSPTKFTSDIIVLAGEKDKRSISVYQENGAIIHSGDFVLLSILQQKMPPSQC
ncbi:hypothetical protein SAMD00019534_088370 [Acytostelium subglobosum LB1]|uniref:hypothetical protein n=1 Tax=Acytostelium subglobosum LB1 TaxID=1410327 RepID=UPI000644D415|nr:hypothetical protein SAMD00019534_088370 [Acytostelium subglobosum LB1]GAM25662.1 hypothetical protein SAMD00019534_088370 [Acytostelium subglobosum LB1]|eukprot:XP_012751180.1 hypothetical protein SAMD00019534_088370 [Acytostelium subglobosum LB1]